MGRPKVTRIKKCENCDKEFDAGNKKHKKNCSESCTKEFNKKNSEERIKKTFDTINKKYGVKSFFNTEGYHDKLKTIKKEKYGDENYNNYEKIKKTLKENYNVEHPSQTLNYKERTESTKLVKYNDKNFNNREKAKKTIKNKYNVDHHLQTKESIEKLKNTNREKYGVEFTILTEKSKQNLINHNIEKYGSNYYFSSDLHLNFQKNKKIIKIKSILDKNDLKFDINQYNKLREKNSEGKLHYIKYHLTCKTCDNIFEWSFESIPVCRRCYPLTSISKLQGEFKDFLNNLNVKYIESTKQVISPLELDFYLEDYDLAFELNGNYFHSELGGNKYPKYHLIKSEMCNNKNIKLIHIFEDEWLFKKDIVKSRVLNYLNLTENKIYARQCVVKKIESSIKKEFLESNHIQGNDICFEKLGLFYKEELVSVMTFTKPRLALGKKIKNQDQNMNSVELSRFCSKINYNIIGGFEKLLNFFIKDSNQINEIYTFADCRWSGLNPEKTVYNKCGFEFINRTKPNYFYFEKNDYYTRHHRFKFNKQKLIQIHNENPNLTEWEIARKYRYDRIWDCGSLKFNLKLR